MWRRLFVSHILTVLAALVTMLAVTSGVIHLVNDHYQKQFESMQAEQMESAQALLEAYAGTGDWAALDGELKKAGFDLHVYITYNGRVSYSSLNNFQMRIFRSFFAHQPWPEDSVLTVQNEGFWATGHRDGSHSVVAILRPDPARDQRPRGEATLLSIAISGVISIIVIIVLSSILTRRQIQSIMRPVNALTAAAQRIEGGDYSQAIAYGGRDEFSAVCDAFDQMQEHLVQEQKKNLAYEDARTSLVAGISHDLRTPLTSVKGYLKGLRDGVANTPEKQRQYVDIAYRRACDMDVLLQRLFYFSKLETGNLPLFLKSVDLGEFARSYICDEAGEVEQRGGEMALTVQPGPHPVKLDTEQMYRVLNNLTVNALRYSGAAALKIAIEVWTEEAWEHIRFSDNGCGVPPEQLSHLFEQFWRGDQARQRNENDAGGSGLGLYIVKYIVEAHGGSISVRSDGGLSFEMILPRDREVRG